MKKATSALRTVIAMIMLLTLVLTGCGGNSPAAMTPSPSASAQASSVAPSAAPTQEAIDTSEPVKITGYLMGTERPGFQDVLKELNVRLSKDINATMEISYIGWGEYQAQYPLILASGEDVDWIYTSNWCFYFQEAAKGAFYEITGENLQKFMPRTAAALTDEMKQQTYLKGKQYMIPTVTPDRKIFAAIIRGDLRKKYGVAEIKKFSEIEPYLDAIKNNEKQMVPMNLDSAQDIYVPYTSILAEKDAYYIDIMSAGSSGSGLCFKVGENNGKLYMPTDDPLYSNSVETAKLMKSWYEKGYFNQDVFANNVLSTDAYKQGKSGVGFGNSVSLQETLADAASKGWEPELIPLLDSQGHYRKDPYINNGFAIAASSKNPERTMMAMDLICQEKSYNYLVYYGIEGKNYVVKDGKIALPEGLTADKNDYPPDKGGFWFTNKDQHLPLESWSKEYIQLTDDIKNKGYLIDDRLAAFSPDIVNIKTEIANLNTVGLQYMVPLYVGMIDDVEAAFKTRADKLKAAGIERVYEELSKQLVEYLK